LFLHLYYLIFTHQKESVLEWGKNMKAMTKIALISASVLSMGALTACQSTNNVNEQKDHSRMMKHHEGQKQHRLTPEQREQFKAARAERMQLHKQIQQACDGKAAGSAVQIKAGDKTIDGQCKISFKPDHKGMKGQRGEFRGMRSEHRPMRGEFRGGMNRGEALTDSQRAEMVKQYDQRLSERQALQTAFANACKGRTHGKAVQVKAGTQTIDGQCIVHFQPNAPIKMTKAAS